MRARTLSEQCEDRPPIREAMPNLCLSVDGNASRSREAGLVNRCARLPRDLPTNTKPDPMEAPSFLVKVIEKVDHPDRNTS